MNFLRGAGRVRALGNEALGCLPEVGVTTLPNSTSGDGSGDFFVWEGDSGGQARRVSGALEKQVGALPFLGAYQIIVSR